MSDVVDILSLTPDALQKLVAQMGEPAFRARQLFGWLHEKRVGGFSEMTNLPKPLQAALEQNTHIAAISERDKQRSADGTVKYLFAFEDGNCVETVAMDYHHGLSLCISSQMGCRMGCVFCASTQNGLARDLTAAEMLLQVYAVSRELGRRVSSIVIMGIGEPLENLANVLDFYAIITDPNGYGLGRRAVSVSTCGLADKIDELARYELPLTLSVSLHAARDDKRSALMPINRRYNIERLMRSCRNYIEATGRRISFEYAVIHGENDSAQDADDLARLLRGMLAHVNLIPVNSAVRGDMRATRAQAEKFRGMLAQRGLNATVRRTLGADIDAACGQLRNRNSQQ